MSWKQHAKHMLSAEITVKMRAKFHTRLWLSVIYLVEAVNSSSFIKNYSVTLKIGILRFEKFLSDGKGS